MWSLHYVMWFTFSLALALLLSLRGYKKKSLSLHGALTAACVGLIHMLAGLEFGGTLIAFYMSSSKLTRYQQRVKSQLEDGFREGGQRSPTQVLSNSLVGCVCAIFSCCWSSPWVQHIARRAFLAHYACCCADTWASEVGILSKVQPRLITSFRLVPPGTNGAVSALGTACSAGAGLFMGLTFTCLSQIRKSVTSGMGEYGGATSTLPLVGSGFNWDDVVWGVGLGVAGSLVDSLLGASLQYSGYDMDKKKVVSRPGTSVKHISGVHVLSNDQVNFVSALLTSLTAAVVASTWG